jgi:hypothetical protein
VQPTSHTYRALARYHCVLTNAQLTELYDAFADANTGIFDWRSLANTICA